METPIFRTKEELLTWLVNEKNILIAQKKAVMKHADGISHMDLFLTDKDEAVKANQPITEDVTQLKVRAAINTTNIMDSHSDVHLPGLWSKSLKENKSIMHLQEHQMAFDKIISSGQDLKPYVKTYTWKELGFDYPGNTEALVFDSTVKASRNPYMFSQYKDGNVTNHSVGMRYVKIALAIQDKNIGSSAEVDTWNKYIDQIVNRKAAEDQGYFWAVTEAKVIEGSAVPIGSNQATPTIDNNFKVEPLESTHKQEPSLDTRKDQITFFKHLNF